MPETKSKILARAKSKGFKKSSIVKGEKGYFLSPKGVETVGAKKTYASCRSSGGNKEKCAKISWYVEKKNK